MKVAILICGHVRFFKDYIDQFNKHVIKCNPDYNFDIFCHMWDTVNSKKTHTFERAGDKYREINKPFDFNAFYDDFKVTQLVVEKEYDNLLSNKANKFEIDETHNENRIYAIVSQYYKLKQCWHLMDTYKSIHNINYKVIMRIRVDNFYNDDICIPKFEQPNTLYTSRISRKDKDFVPDKLAVGQYNVMKVYCSLYDNLERLYAEHKHKHPFDPERYLFHLLTENDIDIVRQTNKIDLAWWKNR